MKAITNWSFKNVKKVGKDEEYTIFTFNVGKDIHTYKIDNIRHLVEDADKVANYKQSL